MTHLGRQKLEMGTVSINAKTQKAAEANGVKSKNRFTAGNEVIEMSIEKSIEEASANMIAQGHSLAFLRRHPTDYNPCAANNQLLLQEISRQELPWDLDSLETVFYELTQRGALAPPASQAPVIDKAVQDREAVEAAAKAAAKEDPFKDYPLPETYQGRPVPDIRTKRDYNQLSSELYKFWYHHRVVGPAFRARVNFVAAGGGQ